jgi:NinB protein
MKQRFILAHDVARQRAVDAVREAPVGFVVTVAEQTRNTDQNAAMWPILEAFSAQLDWPVNGCMQKLSSAEWKDLLSAAFRKEVGRVAPGINGGFVMLGQRTSTFSKREFSDWLEFLHSVAADRGVEVYQEDERVQA